MVDDLRADDESLFLATADILVPGESGLVAIVQSFFDESYEDSGELFCVAGYVFTKLDYQSFEIGWRAMLRRHSLPFFRMSACAHGAEPFNGLSKDAR